MFSNVLSYLKHNPSNSIGLSMKTVYDMQRKQIFLMLLFLDLLQRLGGMQIHNSRRTAMLAVDKYR
jgi:hypothetical protein